MRQVQCKQPQVLSQVPAAGSEAGAVQAAGSQAGVVQAATGLKVEGQKQEESSPVFEQFYMRPGQTQKSGHSPPDLLRMACATMPEVG